MNAKLWLSLFMVSAVFALSVPVKAFELEMGVHGGVLSSGKGFAGTSFGTAFGRLDVGYSWRVFELFGEAFTMSMEGGWRFSLGGREKLRFLRVFVLPTVVGEAETIKSLSDLGEDKENKIPTSWNFCPGVGFEIGRSFREDGRIGNTSSSTNFALRVEFLPKAFHKTVTLGKGKDSNITVGVKISFQDPF